MDWLHARVDFIFDYIHVLILFLYWRSQSRGWPLGCECMCMLWKSACKWIDYMHVLILFLTTYTCWFYFWLNTCVDFIFDYTHVLILFLTTYTCWFYFWLNTRVDFIFILEVTAKVTVSGLFCMYVWKSAFYAWLDIEYCTYKHLLDLHSLCLIVY